MTLILQEPTDRHGKVMPYRVSWDDRKERVFVDVNRPLTYEEGMDLATEIGHAANALRIDMFMKKAMKETK